MDLDFYAQVFAPAIAKAVRQGRSYDSIRDTLRKDSKPARLACQLAMFAHLVSNQAQHPADCHTKVGYDFSGRYAD